MTSLPLEPEVLIYKLSHRPRHLLMAMITIPNPPKPPDPTVTERLFRSRASSLGMLDRLPPELMFAILEMLDLQSVTRFTGVSSRGNLLVQSQPAYRDLVAHASHALGALSKVGLLSSHSIAKLHTALRSQRCATCTEYGAFLFLPTCQRCCWQCLRYNPLLRMLSPKEAKRYFGLSIRHLHQLPRLVALPGKYGIAADPAPKECELVSVQSARALGLVVHGSAEKLMLAMARRCKSVRTQIIGRYVQCISPATQDQDPLLLRDEGNIPTDRFFGMASIPFPSLPESGEVEEGLWCRGCEFTLRQYDSMRLSRDVLGALVPSGREPQRVLLGWERRARAKGPFLDHIKHCYGAQQLLSRATTTTV